jgi:cell division protease FtsH
MPPPRDPNAPAKKPRRRPEVMPGSWMWLLLLVLLVFFMIFYVSFSNGTVLLYSEALQLVEAGTTQTGSNLFVKRIDLLGNNRLQGELQEDARKYASGEKPLPSPEKIDKGKLREADEILKKIRGSNFTAPIFESDLHGNDSITTTLKKSRVAYTSQPDTTSFFSMMVTILLPALIVLGIFFFFLYPRFRDPLGGGFLSNYIKSPAKRYEKNRLRVTFEDVADMQYAKSELQEIVDFLKDPQKFARLGAQVPKGVLLIGPPGTGKTLLARAVAGEAGVPFFSISGSEFIQMFVGVGASRVRDMFKNAKENAPCLLFIDEIDAVGRMRGAGVGGGSDEREQTLNQILSEMDGFQPTESVIVLAATNRPDVLDSALLRPGRFDRHVTIDRPTWQGRLEILKVHTRNKPLADDINLEAVARKMIGMTGADLRNLANEAALLATREGKNRIGRDDFERASDRVLMGPKREEILTQEGKRRTANHEAGHALVSWLEPACDPPQKVTIIPRGRALGVTFLMPEEENYHQGMDYFKARLTMMMGGRAADRLVYSQAFAGHEDDLKQATRLARYMVTHWGMSDRLGPMSFRIGEEHVFLGKELQEPRDFSEETAHVIDEEVQRLVRDADDRAFELLDQNRDMLERLTEALIQKEELLKEEIDALLGVRPANNGVYAKGAVPAQPPKNSITAETGKP